MPSDSLSQRILAFLQDKGYHPTPRHELATALGVDADAMGDLDTACRSLGRRGRIILGALQTVMRAPPRGCVIGTFRANRKGFGFVIPFNPTEQDDLFVPPGAANGAITDDTVLARMTKQGKRGGVMRYAGRVLEIIQRGRTRFVGELCGGDGHWFVAPDGGTVQFPIVVRDTGAKNGRRGDQVVVDILEYPTPDTDAVGVIVRVLGKRGEPNVETQSIIEQYELPGAFDEDVLDETRAVVDGYDPNALSPDREDLRKRTIITIDPVDARDFDDAISLDHRDDGSWELGVHIADVAHFVREGGALDTEARKRANSIYLPGTVIPMLPELLSNGVCSLQECRDRLTKSAFITYDERGEVTGTRFANTVIRSTKRLTYEQASQSLEGKPGRMSAKVRSLLHDMDSLARAIRARRLREGMLELDLPEAELVYDNDGRAVDVAPADTSFTHKIIEMFMVEANEAVARKLTKLDLPFLRRVHAAPEDLSDGTLNKYLAVLGHTLDDRADRFALQSLLNEVRGGDEAFPVHLAVLRAMSRAEYAPKHVEHYALASANYCHFTSPIRRYPDLTVHRLLDLAIRGGLTTSARERAASEEEVARLGQHCCDNERRAEAASRELRQVFVLQLLEDKVGETFDAVVTGLTTIGAFVQIQRYMVDALLPFDRLGEERWEIDPSSAAALSRRTGARIVVGDRLKITIVSIHVPSRRMEVGLAEALPVRPRHAGTGKTDRPKGRGRPTGKRTSRHKPTPRRRRRR